KSEVTDLQKAKYITIISNRRKIMLSISSILYVLITGRNAEIHVSGGKIYKTRMTLNEIEDNLGEGFIKVHRGCIVSAMAIHNITDNINLSNGESLEYTIRKKNEIIDQLSLKQQNIINSFMEDGIPITDEEYRKHYSSFDNMPFAFTDIEMVFNEESHAVDWIFRYGNTALARLEKIPLNQLIGNSFGNLFSNMDSKWLRSYERATLYGETLEIIDYSPEIDTYLKVICFPTFKGHCGCILFDISEIKFTKNSSDAEKALMLYFGNPPKNNG
ncbi:MAG: LytTR family transcriptional regulator DNA-binding domain-containing protein, partial [Acutalibacteraceae bacterium]